MSGVFASVVGHQPFGTLTFSLLCRILPNRIVTKPSVESLGTAMAHVKLREDPGTNIRALYLVDATVGRGSANRRDDVQLVQFFLNALWGKSPDKKTVIGGGGAAPAVDGVCGRATVGAIEIFQRWYWQQPLRGGFADARVEPLPVGQLFGPLHNLPFTIIGLNVNFGFAFGVDRHARLSKEPNFPMELKPKLFV